MISWLIISFFSYIMYGAVTQTISSVWPSIAANLNVDITIIGIIMGVFLAVNVVTLPLASVAISKVGVKNNLAIGSLFLGIASICFAIAKNVMFCFFAMALMGIGGAILDTTSNYYITLRYKPKHLTWLHCMWALGSTIGTSFMASLMKNNFTYKEGFFIIGPICILLAICIVGYKFFEKSTKEINKDSKDSRSNSEEKKKKPKVNFIEIIKMKYVLLFLICMFFVDFLPNIFTVWYTSFATIIQNRTLAFGSYVVSIFFAGQVISRILSGFVVEKVESMKVVLVAIFLVLISSISSLFYINDIIIFITFFILGVGVAPLYPLFMDIAKKIFGIDQLRGVIGLSGSFAKAGGFMASVFVGFLINIFSLNCIFIVLLIGSIIAVIFVNLLFNLTKSINNENLL